MTVINLSHTIRENRPVYPGWKPPIPMKATLCGNDLFQFSCFPLKPAESDSSPVRAAAWMD